MNRHAEQAVIAAAVTSPIALAEAKRRVTAADFYFPEHERIWNAILRLERHGKDVGWITVQHVITGDGSAMRAMPDLIGMPVVPEHTGNYADIVRDKATLRRLHTEAQRVAQLSDPLRDGDEVSGRGLAASVASRFAAIRDSGLTDDDLTTLTLEELMTTPDEPYDWVIEKLIERGDRLILTGEEGLGKSHLLRQVAILAAAGLEPFQTNRIKPIKAAIVDCENTERQVRRKTGELYDFAVRHGQDPGSRVVVECPGRLDVTADRDLARLHHMLDAVLPDLLVIGPLYRLVPRAIQTDDDAAPVLTAIDSIRDRGVAVLIEAHAGHTIGKHGQRDLRPRGSSALLGWPEFGYGMRGTEHGCDFVPWRGDRDERAWPKKLRQGSAARWLPDEAPSAWTPTGAAS